MLRRIGWSVMTLSAVLLALFAARYFFPGMPGAFPQQADLYADIRPWLLMHIAGGIVRSVPARGSSGELLPRHRRGVPDGVLVVLGAKSRGRRAIPRVAPPAARTGRAGSVNP